MSRKAAEQFATERCRIFQEWHDTLLSYYVILLFYYMAVASGRKWNSAIDVHFSFYLRLARLRDLSVRDRLKKNRIHG